MRSVSTYRIYNNSTVVQAYICRPQLHLMDMTQQRMPQLLQHPRTTLYISVSNIVDTVGWIRLYIPVLQNRIVSVQRQTKFFARKGSVKTNYTHTGNGKNWWLCIKTWQQVGVGGCVRS